MKKLVLLFGMFMSIPGLHAQNLKWANTINNTYNDNIYDMQVDHESSVYICGQFSFTVDFDPGPDTANMTCAGGNGSDIYIAKYDSSGNYIWSHSFGTGFLNDEGDRLATDTAGNVYLTGFFGSTVDFDPSPANVASISASGNSRARFLAKYDKNGNFINVKKVGNAVGSLPSSQDAQTGLGCDRYGNVYMSGFYGTTLTLGPGGNGTLSVSGLSDNYFCKYDSALNLIWANRIGSNGTEYSQGMYVEENGTVIVLGSFSNTVDFDPGPGNVSLTQTGNTNDGYFAQYDSGGQLMFVRHLEPGSSCTPRDAIMDDHNNIIVTGSSAGMLDADPDTGVVMIGAGYNDQVFLAAYDSLGNYRWAFAYGDINAFQAGTSVSLDSAGTIYLTGFYQPWVDLDPGADTAVFGNLYSGFIAIYDSGGNYVSAFSGQTPLVKLCVYNQSLYLSGGYYGLVDFDPGPAVYTMMSDTANASWFMLRLGVCQFMPVTPGTIEVPVFCAGDTITVRVSQGGPQYEWTFTSGLTPVGNVTGDSVLVAIDTASVNETITCRSIGGCLNSAIVYTSVNIHHPVTPAISHAGDTLYTISPAVIYQWLLNGIPIPSASDSVYVPSATGNYSIQVTDSNGCETVSPPYSFILNTDEMTNTETVTIYPNPFTSSLTVERQFSANELVIGMKDVFGKTIFKKSMPGGKSIIEIPRLSPGIYLLEWMTNGVIHHRRMVKAGY